MLFRFFVFRILTTAAFSPHHRSIYFTVAHHQRALRGISSWLPRISQATPTFITANSLPATRCADSFGKYSNNSKYQVGRCSRRIFFAGGGSAVLGVSLFPNRTSAKLPNPLPVEFNELDSEAADILRKDNVSKLTNLDNVFAFRGGKLLKTNREGAIRYFARYCTISRQRYRYQQRMIPSNTWEELSVLYVKSCLQYIEVSVNVFKQLKGTRAWTVHELRHQRSLHVAC